LIVVDVAYSSDVAGAFRLHGALHDVQTGAYFEHLVFTPEDVAQPFPVPDLTEFRRFVGLGGETIPALASTPTEYPITLNDRAELQKAGQFEIYMDSDRVFADLGIVTGPERPGFPIRSNSISIAIVPATPEWKAQELAEIRKLLDTTPLDPNQNENPDSPRARAIRRLSMLNSDDATREMVKRFAQAKENETSLYFGPLLGAEHKDAATAELIRFVADPDYGVTSNMAWMLGALPRGLVSVQNRVQAQQDLADSLKDSETQLRAALSAKRGAAFATTFATIEGLRRDAGPEFDPHEVKQFVPQLIEEFPHLSEADRANWLSENWGDVKDPAWIPTLRATALQPLAENASGTDADQQREIRDVAMAAWVDVDPEGSRQTILAELENPNSQFAVSTLSGLRDESLPEPQQHEIARAFLTATEPDAQERFSQVLERYGDATAWKDISTKIGQSLRLYSCKAQASLIHFAASHAPDAVDPLLDNAMAPPENGADDCRADILDFMAASPKREAMETYAISALNDTNLAVVQSAAEYLKARGSSHSEEPLWRRYEIWASVKVDVGDRSAPPTPEVSQHYQTGKALIDAIESGAGWLTDGAKIEHLGALAPAWMSEEISGAYLSMWEHPPLVVHCYSALVGGRGRFDIAQYSTNDLDELKAKLEQFPSGTSLAWDAASCSGQSNAAAMFNGLQSSMSLNGVTFRPATAAEVNPAGDGDDSNQVAADRILTVY
jgi:hypothetical protein